MMDKQKLIHLCVNITENHMTAMGDEVIEIARITLAALEAEPIGEIIGNPDDIGLCSDIRVYLPIGTQLYATPPAASRVPNGADSVIRSVGLESLEKYASGWFKLEHIATADVQTMAEYFVKLHRAAPSKEDAK